MTGDGLFDPLRALKITLASIGLGIVISSMAMTGEVQAEGESVLDDFNYGYWVDWSSRHTSRGRDYLDGDGAFSQGIYFGSGPFGLELLRSGAMENGTEELNLGLSYYREFECYSCYGAYEYSDWSTIGFQVGGHSLEFGATYFDLPAGLWVSGDVEYSLNRRGFFSELTVGADLELTDRLTLTPAVSAGFNSGYVDEGHDGLNHAVASLSADFSLTERVTLSASVAYNWAIDSDLAVYSDDALLRDFLWTGLTVSVGGGSEARSVSSGEDWEIIFGTSVWVTAFEGSISTGAGSPGEVQPLDDSLDQIHTGLSVEAQRGRWCVLADGAYASFGAEVPAPLPIFLPTPAEVRVAGLQLAAGYWVVDAERAWVDFLVGARYHHVETEYLFAAPESREFNWVDPTVGLRARLELWDDWELSGRAEWGGFGIGSDAFWQVDVGLAYELSDGLSVELRYQHLEVDYRRGDNAVEFGLKGPKLGLNYRF